MRSLRAAVVGLIGVVIGAVFLWLALRAIDLRVVFVIVSRADRVAMLGIIGCAFAFVGVKALRWRCLIRHLRPLSSGRLIGPVFAGVAVNYGIPNGGELVRAWMVARREHVSKVALLASIAVERLFDFCAVLLLGVFSLIAGRTVLDMFGAYLWVLLAFIMVTLGFVLPFALWPAGALGMSRFLLKPLPRPARDWILRHVGQGIEGLGSLQQGSTLAQVLGLSVVQWTLMGGCVWFSLRAVGVDPSAVMALVILLLLVVGMILPTAPVGVGTTQVAFLLAATPFGVNREETLAASLVLNVLLPVPLIAVGAGVLLSAWSCQKRSTVRRGQ